jgi:hypothetical protein
MAKIIPIEPRIKEREEREAGELRRAVIKRAAHLLPKSLLRQLGIEDEEDVKDGGE